MLRAKYRVAQHLADAAATAAANALANGQSMSDATNAAITFANSYNGAGSASVDVQIPPADGAYAGQAGFAQVRVSIPVPTVFMQTVGASSLNTVDATAVAGTKDSTGGAAIVILDPDPPGITLPTIAGITLPATPSLVLGGLEILGLGKVTVNGAVLVNNRWGGFDQNGNKVGEPSLLLLRAAVTATPLLPLTAMESTDLRVTGGVDYPNLYQNVDPGKSTPLRANQKPVPDPLASLPVPTVSADPVHVDSTLRGGVSIISLPLIGPPTTLSPGVYEYIQILAGNVTLQSGVYIIRNAHPLTGIPLQIVAGTVTGNGVMFYITPNANYSAASGMPDAADPATSAPSFALTGGLISATINVGLLGSQLTPLNGTGSVYDQILIFQNRSDRRIMVLTGNILTTNGGFAGTVYSKWGHTIFGGMGTYDARFVVGSLRFLNILGVTFTPSQLLPAAKDVYLVQ